MTLNKWKEIGPLNLDYLVNELAIEIDESSEIKEIVNEQYDNVLQRSRWGQMNADQKFEGIGRICFSDGQI